MGAATEGRRKSAREHTPVGRRTSYQPLSGCFPSTPRSSLSLARCSLVTGCIHIKVFIAIKEAPAELVT